MSKYMIIGNSTAGLAALQAIKEQDPGGEVTVISAEPHLPYSRVLLTHLIAGRVSREQMSLAGDDFFKTPGINLLGGARAVKVDPREKTVTLDSGERRSYDNLLVAAGSSPVFSPPFSREDPGVCALRTIEDAQKISSHAGPGARIAIVGGGPVGVKLACALREAGCLPEMIVSSPRLLSQVADDQAAKLVQDRITGRGVALRTGVDVLSLEQGPAGEEILVLSDGTELSCSLVVLCKGVRPNSGMLGDLPSPGGALRVDRRMRTVFADIYAAGDVAETFEITRREYCLAATWPHAVQQGRLAGLNMAGREALYGGSLYRNAMEIFELPFISIGMVRVEPRPDWDVQVMSGEGRYRKLVYRGGRLVGAQLVGEVSDAGALQAEIRRGAASDHASPQGCGGEQACV